MEKRIQHHNRDIQQRGEVALREFKNTAKSASPTYLFILKVNLHKRIRRLNRIPQHPLRDRIVEMMKTQIKYPTLLSPGRNPPTTRRISGLRNKRYMLLLLGNGGPGIDSRMQVC
jgi:hypothetical protein